MDSSTAGAGGIRAQIKAALKAQLDKRVEPILDELADLALELSRQSLVQMLSQGQSPAQLMVSALPATSTSSASAKGNCIVDGCPRRGARIKNGFCAEHYESLSSKDREKYIEAHKDKRKIEFNRKRREQREQDRVAKEQGKSV